MGPGRGYVEHPYLVRNGRTYVSRTYVVNRVSYTRVYRTSYFRGVAYYGYTPPFYFHPRFYGWAYNPWGSASFTTAGRLDHQDLIGVAHRAQAVRDDHRGATAEQHVHGA